MRDIIKQQLQKVCFADLNNFDRTTGTFHIKKYSKPKYEIGKCYLIKLPPDVIGNVNSVVAVNWNRGKCPMNEYYKAYVSKAVGTYIYVDCLAYDFDNRKDLTAMWSGYLDTTTLTQIATI